MSEGVQVYYTEPGPITQVPEAYAGLLAGLPCEVAALCEVVQGVVLHPNLAALYGLQGLEGRQEQEREIRTLSDMLERIQELDPGPLVEARQPEKRLLGTCRTFATLLCGLLRHRGTAARARCGFARYFVPGKGEDHWVCEVWCQEESRWVLVDAQVDAVQRSAFAISLDTRDIGRGEFLPAGAVWATCRSGHAAWSDFGLSMINESGMWFVISNFVRDVAALNKVELLPWDCWGLLGDGEEPRFFMQPGELLSVLSAEDVARLDHLARCSANSVELEQVRAAFEHDDRFGVPSQITSAGPNPKRVDLDAVLGTNPGRSFG